MNPSLLTDRRLRLTTSIIVIGIIASLAWFLFHLGGEVRAGDTRGFDEAVLHAAQALRKQHARLADIMRDFSGVGSPTVLTLVTIGACAYLLLTSAYVTAVVAGLSIIAASLLVGVLKSSFGRTRPASNLAEFVVQGLSYPSGHASMSAVVFLTFGALLARRHRRRREQAFILVVAAVITLLIGVSRAVLGVHWATDVLGGWAFGAAWAVMGLAVVQRFDRGDPVT